MIEGSEFRVPGSGLKVRGPVMRYHGGKWRLAEWVISHFPAHRVFVEVFGGAGSVLMRKRPAGHAEVYNDLNERVVNVFRVLRDPEASGRLAELLRLTPYSKVEFYCGYKPALDPVEDARRMLVCGFQSHGNTDCAGGRKGGWSRGYKQHGPSTAEYWRDVHEHVELWCDRMRGVFVECEDFEGLIGRWDGEDVLFYCDPPYSAQARVNGLTGYAKELEDADHVRLAGVLRGVRGMVVLSGYRSALYDDLFGDWWRVEKEVVVDKGARRVEVLWLNEAARVGLEREELDLFGGMRSGFSTESTEDTEGE